MVARRPQVQQFNCHITEPALNYGLCYILAMSEATSDQEPAPENEIDRKLRELTEELMGEARFKEPTAAERAKRPARDRKQAKRNQRRQRRQAGSGRLKVWVIAVVILAVAGGVVWLRFSHSLAGGASGVQPGGGSGTGGTAPADPFAGNQAANWADGESGIVIPSAKPVGSFTAAQVKGAYEATRKLLIAANLEEQTLLGGAPNAFAGLLTKQQRDDFLAGLKKTGVNKGGYPLSTRKWVASFAPGSAELIGNVIKVHGVMSAQTAREAGGVALAIQVDYLFAYAVEPPGNPSDWMRVIDHQYGSVDFAQWDDPGGPLEPWDQTIIGNAGIRCGTDDGYIHPDYPSERSSGTTQSGPAVDPYSSATSVPGGGAVCGRTSGT